MTNSITKPTLLTLSFLIALTLVLPALVLAQEPPTTVDDSAIDSSLQDLPPERKSVEFEQPKATSGETTSGYTDKNGKPLSREEFLKIREETGKGFVQKQPVISALIVLGILGAIAYFIVKRKKRA